MFHNNKPFKICLKICINTSILFHDAENCGTSKGQFYGKDGIITPSIAK